MVRTTAWRLGAGADGAQARVHRNARRGGNHLGTGQLPTSLRLRQRGSLLLRRQVGTLWLGGHCASTATGGVSWPGGKGKNTSSVFLRFLAVPVEVM